MKSFFSAAEKILILRLGMGMLVTGYQDPILSSLSYFFWQNPILFYFLGNVLFYPIFGQFSFNFGIL